jgi:hypothetical protein
MKLKLVRLPVDLADVKAVDEGTARLNWADKAAGIPTS